MGDQKRIVKVCEGPACTKNMARYTVERASNDIRNKKIKDIDIQRCPCQGNCESGPTIVVMQGEKETRHSHMTPLEISRLLDTIQNDNSRRKK